MIKSGHILDISWQYNWQIGLYVGREKKGVVK